MIGRSDDLAARALFYVRLRLRVLPLLTCDKAPLTTNGVHDASSDPEQIAAWWHRWPAANVGIACGDGLVVFDVDERNGGVETWGRIIHEHNPPAAPFVLTGGGGLHWYFGDPTGRVRSRKLPGVDVQACGKYVVAPPSVHPSGRRYECGQEFPRLSELPAIPASLVDLLDPPQAPIRRVLRARVLPASGATPYGQAGIDGLVEQIRNAPRGGPGGLHDTLYKVAARAAELAGAGHLRKDQAFDTLRDAAVAAACGEGREREIERTIADAFEHVGGKPCVSNTPGTNSQSEPKRKPSADARDEAAAVGSGNPTKQLGERLPQVSTGAA